MKWLKTNFWVWLSVTGIIVYSVIQLFFYLDKRVETKAIKKESKIVRLSDAEINKLEEGDIICRRGYGYISDFIATHLNKPDYDLSHVGILIKSKSGWEVIHSLSTDVSSRDGVQKQTLDSFLLASASQKVVIARFRSTHEKRIKIAAQARDYYEKGIRFDRYGNYNDKDKLFCSELIWTIVASDLHLVEIPAQEPARKNFFYSLAPFYDTTIVEIIKDDFKQEKFYRQ